MITLQSPCCVLKDTIGEPIWNYATVTLKPSEMPCTLLNRITLFKITMGKCAPMRAVKQLNYEEVRTHANFEIASTWKSFERWGTEFFLLSDEHLTSFKHRLLTKRIDCIEYILDMTRHEQNDHTSIKNMEWKVKVKQKKSCIESLSLK